MVCMVSIPIQAVMYNEDFVQERKDRENIHARLVQKEEELQNMRQKFEEELQTKNQQVKQYKKQVDAVKAELAKYQEELRIAQARLQVQWKATRKYNNLYEESRKTLTGVR